MREFVFFLKNDTTKRVSVKVDIIDDKSENFTVMYMEGFEGSIFQKYIPWNIGSVISEDDVNDFFKEFQPICSGVKYGEDEVKTLGVDEHTLTITPTITNGTEGFVIISCKNKFDDIFKKTVPLAEGGTSVVEIIEGYEYSFETLSGDTWVTKPADFVCEGNKAVSLNIAIPIDLPVHEMTITPDITNGSEASIIVVGTKTGYSTIETPVSLEEGTDSKINIYEGYSYEFTLSEDDVWTTGSAPSAIVCDSDESITLGISVPIDLPVHILTITPTLTDGETTKVTLTGTKDGYTTQTSEIDLTDAVEATSSIYEGYSYVFTLTGNDTWTGGSALAAILCDGDEAAALAITIVA